MNHSHVLCLDLGGSKLAWGMLGPQGTLLWKDRRPWQPRTARDILQPLEGVIAQALADAPAGSVQAIGLTIPGPCDPDAGLWLAANFADIGELPIARLLRERFALPAFADNDAKACALAEQRFGAGRGARDFFYLTVSNGIGGAAVADGRLLRGRGGLAGEIGHCKIVPEGRMCSCGQRGCLEAYAAGPGLRLTAQELCGAPHTGEELAALARAGDAKALRAWALEGEYLGHGIAHAVNLLDPQAVILGGGLSLAFPLYETSLRAALRAHAFPRIHPLPDLLPTPLGYDGGLYGAAAVALNRLQTDKEDYNHA